MADLTATIKNLVATGKEGDYWDFKRESHAKPGELLKDIVCLANSTRHIGDRYIIYGVDNTGSILGVRPNIGRTQADIVDMLSKAGFAGGVYPEIYLEEIELEGKKLEVLLIKDRPEKPYYLFMDPRKVRVYIKDPLVKSYERERLSSLEGDVWRLLSFPDPGPSVEGYIKPHGRRLNDGKIVCWGNSRDWKLILMAVFQRSHTRPESEAFGAVLLESGRTVDEHQRELIREVASRLDIQNLV